MNTVSITIRPRGGTNLGSSSPPGLPEYIVRIGEEFSISVEKPNTSGSHIQMAVKTIKRLDNIKRALIKFFPNLDDNEKKFAIIVKKHNDFDGLVGYTLKECTPYAHNLKEPLEYYSNIYSRKSNPNQPLIDYVKLNIKYLLLDCEDTNELLINLTNQSFWESEDDYLSHLRKVVPKIRRAIVLATLV